MMSRYSLLAIAALCVAGIASAQTADPYRSTYTAPEAPVTAIVNATILTGAGTKIEDGSILIREGRIEAIGQDLRIPKDVVVVDGRGKWVTPGIIDIHSHLGVFPSPSVPSTRDGNEKTGPNTAEVWAEHAVWPQDPGFDTARRGGVTTMQVLPGSANLFGGRTVVLKNVPAVTVAAMKFPDSPQGLKMACGENPIAEYGSKGRTPFTRMGNMAAFRQAWTKAREYRAKRVASDTEATGGTVDLRLETLSGVLAGDIVPHIHCYRADEMAQMIALSKEFGFEIGVFHHATEAYKIAPLLASEGVAVATWANRWGFKLEAYDGVEANGALLEAFGVDTILHSDSAQLIQRLNIEAALALAAGNNAGIHIDRVTAIDWITSNPARALGIIDQTGSIETGKMADIVLWSGDPFSVYSKADQVYIDGVLQFDREASHGNAGSDFLVGRS